MIVTRLYGGLGNQMFQYAFAFALSSINKCDLYLDVREFDEVYSKNTVRKFDLDKFQIKGKVASEKILHKFRLTCNASRYKWFRKIAPWLPQGFLMYFKEKGYAFNASIQKNCKWGYLDGYWQSYKYFDAYRDQIVKQFIPINIDKKNREVAEEIKRENSISLHVRRGDYVTNPHANQTHGICSLGYYKLCIEKLEKNIDNLHFYLFSDDPTWVKENLIIHHPITIMDRNGSKDAHIDLYLMSLCKHHIIANSSFSWWGAWLSNSKNKIVFSPHRWFQSGESTDDLIPESWEKVKG